jgi:hypothetical protein
MENEMSELNFKKIINSLIICAEFADLAAGEGIEINGIDPSDAIMDLIDQLDLSGDEVINIRESLEAWNTRAAPKVKALVWFKLRELCHVSSPCANLEYRVLEQGVDFFVTINGERFGSSNSIGLAQAMAQGHFEKLILEALE